MIPKNSAILKKFGERVRDIRLRKGISSQMTFANKAGLDRTYIGGVERGERNVSLINIEKIAKTLNVNIEDLFKF
ncbi:MAG: helix-turn-helix transcriptional regulator [Patescibacteria group bacterium]